MQSRDSRKRLLTEGVNTTTTDDLPGAGFWALIHPHTGDVTDVRRTPRGFNSHLTAVIECAPGPFFVKAVRNRPGGRRDSLLRERLINPHVRPVAPALRWHAEDDAWLVLGFAFVRGRFADLTPGSADLPTVVDLLSRISRLELPPVAHDWAETRWDRYAESDGETELFRGDVLLHTDIHPDNLLIGQRQVWAVDWAWPTRGPGFIDPALLVVQLVAAGHTPESAEAWAARCPAWRRTDPEPIDAFAAATVRMYRHLVQRRPDAEWLAAMGRAASAWATHRGLDPDV